MGVLRDCRRQRALASPEEASVTDQKSGHSHPRRTNTDCHCFSFFYRRRPRPRLLTGSPKIDFETFKEALFQICCKIVHPDELRGGFAASQTHSFHRRSSPPQRRCAVPSSISNPARSPKACHATVRYRRSTSSAFQKCHAALKLPDHFCQQQQRKGQQVVHMCCPDRITLTVHRPWNFSVGDDYLSVKHYLVVKMRASRLLSSSSHALCILPTATDCCDDMLQVDQTQTRFLEARKTSRGDIVAARHCLISADNMKKRAAEKQASGRRICVGPFLQHYVDYQGMVNMAVL